MKKYILFLFFAVSKLVSVKAQKSSIPENEQQVYVSLGFGNKQGTISVSYYYN